MLKKLIKYDLKWINKYLVYYYIITLAVAIITRIQSNFIESVIGIVIYRILYSIEIGCLISCLINGLMRIWVRFKNNLYKDESYLTHTLPVSKSTLYNSKIISNILSILLTVIVIVLSIGIAYLDNETIKVILGIIKDYPFEIILLYLIVVLETFYMMFCGVTRNSNRS